MREGQSGQGFETSSEHAPSPQRRQPSENKIKRIVKNATSYVDAKQESERVQKLRCLWSKPHGDSHAVKTRLIRERADTIRCRMIVYLWVVDERVAAVRVVRHRAGRRILQTLNHSLRKHMRRFITDDKDVSLMTYRFTASVVANDHGEWLVKLDRLIARARVSWHNQPGITGSKPGQHSTQR
jgi:hypothetical protein